MRKILIGISGIGLCVAIAVISIAVFSDRSEASAVGGTTISSGVPVQASALPAGTKRYLEIDHYVGPVKEVGELRGTSFFSGTNDNGESCFIRQSTTDPSDASSFCHSSGSVSELNQLLPLIEIRVSSSSADENTITDVSGVAADEVAAVGLIGNNGDLYKTEVKNNVFKMPEEEIPNGQPKALVVLDDKDDELLKVPLS
jgi:hypothetical protein